jgi:hypothetical protein
LTVSYKETVYETVLHRSEGFSISGAIITIAFTIKKGEKTMFLTPSAITHACEEGAQDIEVI